MVLTVDHLNQYMAANANKWAPATLKSERARLIKLLPILNGRPEVLWQYTSAHLAPYSAHTTWIRAAAFYQWLADNNQVVVETGGIYSRWMDTNRRLFKNTYRKETIPMTYDEAVRAVASLPDASIRRRAMEILGGSLRYCESGQPLGRDFVIGKGGKERPDFRPLVEGPDYTGSYSTFWRALKSVGLKPHSLRKLALTKMVSNGATLFDLMQVAGWSSPTTAASYVQPQQTSKLKMLLAA